MLPIVLAVQLYNCCQVRQRCPIQLKIEFPNYHFKICTLLMEWVTPAAARSHGCVHATRLASFTCCRAAGGASEAAFLSCTVITHVGPSMIA